MKNLLSKFCGIILAICLLFTQNLNVCGLPLIYIGSNNFSFNEETGTIYFEGNSDLYLDYTEYYDENSKLDSSKVKEIDFSYDYDVIIKGAIFGHTEITELHIPSNVKFEQFSAPFYGGDIIDSEQTFYANSKLESVYIGCSSIDNTLAIFSDNDALTKIEFVGEGLKVECIPECFALRCISLENITLPEAVKTIERDAFSDCISLKYVSLPKSLQTIEYLAFTSCTSLENISLPNSLETIGWCSFRGCTNLKNVYVPNSVVSIEEYALGYYLTIRNNLYYEDTIYPDFTIYGHNGTEAQRYATDNEIPFIDVDELKSTEIISTQRELGAVGTETPLTLSVFGHPDYIELKSSLSNSQKILKENAEIVRNELGETWTFNVTPDNENTVYEVSASYCGGDIVTTDEITVTALDVTPVNSVEVIEEAFIGEMSTLEINVDENIDSLRVVDKNLNTITVLRENANITQTEDKEIWTVSIPVTQIEQTLTVYAKAKETGWSEQGTSFIMRAKTQKLSDEIKSLEIAESEDFVIYQGVNEIKLKTTEETLKVQFYQNGNTWTYTKDNATVETVNGEKVWTIKMNFVTLGDQQFLIRTRTPKTTFTVNGQLALTVYAR